MDSRLRRSPFGRTACVPICATQIGRTRFSSQGPLPNKKDPLDAGLSSFGWGTRIRTWVDGVRVRSPTARRSPKSPSNHTSHQSPIGTRMDSRLRRSPFGQKRNAFLSVGTLRAPRIEPGLTRAIPGARPAGALRASKSAILQICDGVRVRSPTARRSPNWVGPRPVRLALGVLRRPARFLETDFLTFDFPRVTGYEACFAQRRAH